MTTDRYDAMVVGAGPAGSVAALVLARGGVRVALVDKATFPRDKACGDLVGPRGVQTLLDLGISVEGPKVGDMEVIGPTGRRVLLRAFAGATYPGHGLVVPRGRLDATLRQAAIDAGAAPFTGRAGAASFAGDGRLNGFELEGEKDGGTRLTADIVIGADGALSRVGAAAGLVNDARVIWGFAVRGYTPPSPPLPRIYFWEPSRWSGYPGYGWVFPGEGSQANVGLGVGMRADRRSAARAARDMAAFVGSAIGSGPPARPLGSWLKMGMVGTIPAQGRTLLVGDAAGLVNPLQGEGISQAMGSGRAAAEAVLEAGPGGASRQYRAALATRYAPYASTTAPVTAWMLGQPRAVAGIGRLLTAPGVGRLLAGGWAIYWNDLLDGALPGWPRRVAQVVDRVAGLIASRFEDRRAVWDSLAFPMVDARSGSGIP